MNHQRSSRQRYRRFVEDYRAKRLDAQLEAEGKEKALDDASKPAEAAETPESKLERRGKRRRYVREYLRWLWPHRYAVALVFLLALVTAGLQMVEPLFMRFIVDRVLLNTRARRGVTALSSERRRRALRRSSSSSHSSSTCSRTIASGC